ncbi:F-box-like domain-containing protein [Kocuria palustris]|nr:F-box-like domain-containing protein [Kocuria palustris]
MAKSKRMVPILRLPLMEFIGGSDGVVTDIGDYRGDCRQLIAAANYGYQLSPLLGLPQEVLALVCEYVDQFDLVNLQQCCHQLYPVARRRLYRRVTVALDGEFARRFDDSHHYIRECGIKLMDLAFIFSRANLRRFIASLHFSPELIQLVKIFVFDKCPDYDEDVKQIQGHLLDFFGKWLEAVEFLHITFMEYDQGLTKLQLFLRNENVRRHIFKLFVTDYNQVILPMVPPCLTNLLLMPEEESMFDLDLGRPQYQFMHSLFTLTVNTNHHQGVKVLQLLKLAHRDTRLQLKGFTLFHVHNDSLYFDHDGNESGDVRLDFATVTDKIDLTTLHRLHFKIDCFRHRAADCLCFAEFFRDLAAYSLSHGGLPNLENVEIENFSDSEWLRPHQLLEGMLTPIGEFLRTLVGVKRVFVDFATPGYKMFDNTDRMLSEFINKLNFKLVEAFFCLLFPRDLVITNNLRQLVLPDFLTLFVYYKPEFYSSWLHTCRCSGCAEVLDRIHRQFYPLKNFDEPIDHDSTFYLVIGYMLMKLQFDREVCTPIKEKVYQVDQYPIYKGMPYTLHHGFHDDDSCGCRLRPDLDQWVTTYIIHQLRPVIKYISHRFPKLDTVMVHGIYFHRQGDEMVPTHDLGQYPDDSGPDPCLD